ncbi:tRNA (adenosine(37)-N6)-threonylcarbamoyltransferase complex ATPase subunit type 1 TsaE [Chloroflexota bacterium]
MTKDYHYAILPSRGKTLIPDSGKRGLSFYFYNTTVGRYTFLSRSPASTSRFGGELGKTLKEGSILALIGELGCGKTLLTKGICTGLGVAERRVNSPTFVLVNEYQGRLPVYHLDLYRINTTDVFEIGLLDYLHRAESGIMLIEWAEKIIDSLQGDFLRVNFTYLTKNQRRLELTAPEGKFDYLFQELGAV